MIGETVLHWIIISLNYILLATGLTLTISVMRIVNFVHGHIYMAGAFLFYYFMTIVGLPYGIAFLFTMVAFLGLGILIEMKLYRPLAGNLNSQIVMMIAVMLILEGTALTIFGPGFHDIPPLISGSLLAIGNANISAERIMVAAISIVFIAALFFFVKYTKIGKALRATAQDKYAASLMGIDIGLISSLTLGIGYALAALAGIQIGAVYYVSPFIAYPAVITSLLVVIVGGMGSIIGACVGAFIIGFFSSFGGVWVGGFSHLLSFGMVILILILKPTGLFGVSFEMRD